MVITFTSRNIRWRVKVGLWVRPGGCRFWQMARSSSVAFHEASQVLNSCLELISQCLFVVVICETDIYKQTDRDIEQAGTQTNISFGRQTYISRVTKSQTDIKKDYKKKRKTDNKQVHRQTDTQTKRLTKTDCGSKQRRSEVAAPIPHPQGYSFCNNPAYWIKQ